MIKKASVATAKATILKKRSDWRAENLRGGLKGHGSGFIDFVREQGIVGLAVGLAIGTAAGDTVKKLVEAFINPVVQFLVGSGDQLSSAHFVFVLWGRRADFQWGAFVSSAITLVATAFVIYLIVHYLHLDKLDKPKE